MTTCASCGSEISPNSRFCPSCGTAVGSLEFATRTVAMSTPGPFPKSSDSQRSSVSHSSGSVDDSRFLPGALLAGRYRIVALLGRGGMGEVYRADDLTLGQEVALKFLPEAVASYPDAVSRFHNEVRVARQVSHPNVCRVYDVGEMSGHLFLSMEYVDGEDLGSLLRRIGRLPPDKALEIARRLCAGLAAAHEKGVLHRDLKPSNIMLDGRGQVLLTDFGLAGVADELKGAEVRNGTPAYMAPEQLSGKEVTVRSDIYSLGLVLYEILTGKRPFEAGTLEELVRMRTKTAPASPSTLVRNLDPTVERVILRCLEPEPARRPASALSVAAALPGGDPLAAALAAGETPSPEIVAAAAEGTALAPRIAIPLFVAVLLGVIINFVAANRNSALEMIRPELSPEVLSQKARDVIQKLGYPGRRADDEHGFFAETGLIDYIKKTDKPVPHWNEALSQGPPLLRFWYREGPYPLTAVAFHSEMLTPGIVDPGDPPLVLSKMVLVELDHQGRLTLFEAIPDQVLPDVKEAAKQMTPVNWNVLFTAAGLDQAKFQSAEPLWTWLETSDTRAAWTGTWPGTARPLRVEAAAWRGQPVAFSLIGPWTKPDRMPPQESSTQERTQMIFISCIAVVAILGGALLARRNLLHGSGDHAGALRLAAAIFAIHFTLWICRSHLAWSIGTFGTCLVAICTSLAWSAVIWTMYVALEPFIRRHWPRTIISWTNILTGRVRDPIVGRDFLLGIAFGIAIQLIDRVAELSISSPQLGDTGLLLGARSTLGAWLMRVHYGVRGTLLIFLFIFLFRVVLRNEWLAASAFVLIFTAVAALESGHPMISAVTNLIVYVLLAIVVLRFGLLTLAAGIFINDLLQIVPAAWQPSAWYFGSTIFVLASVFALAAWALHTSLAGRRLWNQDLFS